MERKELRKEFETMSFKQNVIEQLGTECVNCGKYANIYHHIVPLAVGGTNRLSNIVPLCEKCHGKVHNRKSLSIKSLQRQGIERAKKQGKYKGRKKIETNDNFIEVYNSWKQGNITAVKAMEELGLKKNTFYRRVKEYEENNININV